MVPEDELLAVKKAVVANDMDLEKVAEDFVKEMSKPIRDLVPDVLNKEDLADCLEFLTDSTDFYKLYGKIKKEHIEKALEENTPDNMAIMDDIIKNGIEASLEEVQDAMRKSANLKKLKGKVL